MPQDPDDERPGEDFHAYIDRLKRQQAAAIAVATRAFEASPAVFVQPDGPGARRREVELHLLTRNMNGPGYRITWLTEDGPRGHDEAPTVAKLMETYVSSREKLRPATDDEVIAYTSPERYVQGAKRVAFIQATNALSYAAGKLGRVAADKAYEDIRHATYDMGDDIDAATAHLERALTVLGKTPKENPMPRTRRMSRSTKLVQNPTPWVTSLLARSFEQLEDRVPPKWLPKVTRVKPKGKSFTAEFPEYGCGNYGCVLPTLDPGVVLKVTSDESEAKFAKELAPKLPTPICVAFHLTLSLGGPRTTRQKRPTYLLWREEASEVGKIDEVVGEYAEDAISSQHAFAKYLLNGFWESESAESMEMIKASWLAATKKMGRVPELAFVADGMVRAATEAGIYLLDVHGGNLGLCARNGSPTWVITDPGNVIVT